MPLTPDEVSLIRRLTDKAQSLATHDERVARYYEGAQRLAQIGLAVPPEMRQFEMVVNWPRVVVDTIENRQDVKSLLLPGDERDAAALREGWLANHLDSDLSLLNRDVLVYGRGFMCVGSNADDPAHPLITVESPREITVDVDPRTRRASAALRLYGVDRSRDARPIYATLYLPDATVWAQWDTVAGSWVEYARDNHRLGRVPVVMFLNRRRTGEWVGQSEMEDVIPLTDGAARTLTNNQFAQETLAVPQRYALSLSRGDFVGPDGQPLPVWEAYYGKFLASANKDAKIGQLDGADLSNFHSTIDMYGRLASTITGFPPRYFGQFTTNPPAEGAIRAEEAQMVKRIERKNTDRGAGLGWVMGLYERFRTGEWTDGNQIKVEWHDPGTPTFAQKADALQKLAGGVPILSREGAWDELGWSDARKERERGYFEQESSDPFLGLTVAKEELDAGADTSVVDG